MIRVIDELKRRVAYIVSWRAHQALEASQPNRAIALARRAVRWLPQGIGYYPYVIEIESLLKLGDVKNSVKAKYDFDKLLQSQTRYNIDTAMFIALYTSRLFESDVLRSSSYEFWDIVPSDIVLENVDPLVRRVFPAQVYITP